MGLPIASIFIGACMVMDTAGTLQVLEIESTASDAQLMLIGALVIMYGHGAFAAFKSNNPFVQSQFHFWAGALAYNWWAVHGSSKLTEVYSTLVLAFACSSVGLALSHWP